MLLDGFGPGGFVSGWIGTRLIWTPWIGQPMDSDSIDLDTKVWYAMHVGAIDLDRIDGGPELLGPGVLGLEESDPMEL